MNELKYPIGEFDFDAEVSDKQISKLVEQIEHFPGLLSKSIEGLSEEQLNSSYRAGGWTIRQVIHHIADTNMNFYVRIKLALTEDCPTIKLFDQTQWAELDDARNMSVDVSLKLIESLNKRWVHLIRSLTSDQLNSKFRHPKIGEVSIKKAISLYYWHGHHHMGFINTFKKRIGLEI